MTPSCIICPLCYRQLRSFSRVIDTMQIAAQQPSLLSMILHPANKDVTGFHIIRFFGQFEQFAHATHNMFVIRRRLPVTFQWKFCVLK